MLRGAARRAAARLPGLVAVLLLGEAAAFMPHLPARRVARPAGCGWRPACDSHCAQTIVAHRSTCCAGRPTAWPRPGGPRQTAPARDAGGGDGAEGERRVAPPRRTVAWACSLLPRFLRGVVLLVAAALLFLLPRPAVSAAAHGWSSTEAELSAAAPAAVLAGTASPDGARASTPLGSRFALAGPPALPAITAAANAAADCIEAAAGAESSECEQWNAVALEAWDLVRREYYDQALLDRGLDTSGMWPCMRAGAVCMGVCVHACM